VFLLLPGAAPGVAEAARLPAAITVGAACEELTVEAGPGLLAVYGQGGLGDADQCERLLAWGLQLRQLLGGTGRDGGAAGCNGG
jgi:hypothetical protein